ncbi:MAG: restriction endonuclease subunit S [Candidatus Brocadiaceae bacterium]
MKRYDKYKPSGIEWIGEIPEHWNLKKLKYVATVQPSNVDKKSIEGETTVLLCNYMDVYKNEFIDTSINFMEATATDTEIEKFRIMRGDVLVTKDSETPDDIASPALVRTDFENVICAYHLTQIRPNKNELTGEYLFRLFQEHRYNGQFEVAANGVTRFGLSVSAFSDAVVPLPSMDEQTAIANYLDEKTAQIDTLIEKKQRLVELQKEERTAIINHAVTKGINPNVKLKPSGIEWLGDIPEHWEMKKLKYVVSKVGSGITPTGGASVYQNEGIPLLRSQNIYNDGLKLDDVAYISENIDEQMSNSRIEDTDVLLNITGASIGRCSYVPKGFGKGNVNQHVCIIRPIKDLLRTKFLHSIIISGYGQTLIDVCQTGANREGLNFQQIKNFDLPMPDIKEQEHIVAFIESHTSRIDATFSKIEKEIRLLQEYRTALISEAVTGKIKVV